MLTLGFSFERGMLLAFNEYGDLELVTPSQVDPTTWSFEKKSLGVEQQLTELWADGDVIPCPVCTKKKHTNNLHTMLFFTLIPVLFIDQNKFTLPVFDF